MKMFHYKIMMLLDKKDLKQKKNKLLDKRSFKTKTQIAG